MANEDITSILLPTSGVDFFMLEKDNFLLAESLKKDWRFARVSIEVSATGMENAIEKYHELVSPELIVVETQNIDQTFLSQLEQLSALCSKGTDAIVIGPKNDVQLYRSLMEMGIKDYLVNPVDRKDLVKAIAKFLIEKRGLTGSKLISVINSKGGAGATSVAQILAYDLAENLQQKTLLLDLGGSTGNMGLSFGLEPNSSLKDIIRLATEGTEDDMKRICQQSGENLSIMLSGMEPVFSDMPDPDKIESLIKATMKKYPIVVVDLSSASRAVQRRVIEISSRVLVVTNALVSSLRSTKILLGEIGRLRTGLNEVDMAINMHGIAGSDEVAINDIKTALNVEPVAVFPYAPKVFVASETAGSPLGRKPENDRIVSKIRPVSEKLADAKRRHFRNETVEVNNSIGGLFKNFFKDK